MCPAPAVLSRHDLLDEASVQRPLCACHWALVFLPPQLFDGFAQPSCAIFAYASMPPTRFCFPGRRAIFHALVCVCVPVCVCVTLVLSTSVTTSSHTMSTALRKQHLRVSCDVNRQGTCYTREPFGKKTIRLPDPPPDRPCQNNSVWKPHVFSSPR